MGWSVEVHERQRLAEAAAARRPKRAAPAEPRPIESGVWRVSAGEQPSPLQQHGHCPASGQSVVQMRSVPVAVNHVTAPHLHRSPAVCAMLPAGGTLLSKRHAPFAPGSKTVTALAAAVLAALWALQRPAPKVWTGVAAAPKPIRW